MTKRFPLHYSEADALTALLELSPPLGAGLMMLEGATAFFEIRMHDVYGFLIDPCLNIAGAHQIGS